MAIYGSNYNYGESPLYKDEAEYIDDASLFIFFPNWNYTVVVSYIYETVITTSYYGREQRKALLPTPMRKLKFTITENKKASTIWNYLLKMQLYSFYCPLYTENILLYNTGILSGLTELLYKNKFCFNLLKLTTFGLLYNVKEKVPNEVVTISKIDNNKIYLSDEIKNNHIGEQTIFYPLINCYLTEKERRDITDTITEISVELTEIIDLSYIGSYSNS